MKKRAKEEGCKEKEKSIFNVNLSSSYISKKKITRESFRDFKNQKSIFLYIAHIAGIAKREMIFLYCYEIKYPHGR